MQGDIIPIAPDSEETTTNACVQWLTRASPKVQRSRSVRFGHPRQTSTPASQTSASLELLLLDRLSEPPRRVQASDEPLLVHEQRREEAPRRDPDHDLPDEPRRLGEGVPHLVARRRVELGDGRDDGVRDLDALRQSGNVVGGEIVQKDVLYDRAADRDAKALGK